MQTALRQLSPAPQTLAEPDACPAGRVELPTVCVEALAQGRRSPLGLVAVPGQRWHQEAWMARALAEPDALEPPRAWQRGGREDLLSNDLAAKRIH